MNQVRVTWTGFLGGPGVTTFYFDGSAVPPTAAIRTFFSSVALFIPSTVTIQVPQTGDTISPTDGALSGSWGVGTLPAAVVGGAGSNTTSASGPQIKWTTGEIADRRNLVGRTFLVPSTAAAFPAADGLLSTANQTTLQAAAAALLGSSPKMRVWHRPKFGPKVAGSPRPITRDGSSAEITGAVVPRKVAVLTTRRD